MRHLASRDRCVDRCLIIQGPNARSFAYFPDGLQITSRTFTDSIVGIKTLIPTCFVKHEQN